MQVDAFCAHITFLDLELLLCSEQEPLFLENP